jgi:hypothetical protein
MFEPIATFRITSSDECTAPVAGDIRGVLPIPEAAAPALDWLNKGVFMSVGGRQPGGVIYEINLVE